jgi:hypothetical protein
MFWLFPGKEIWECNVDLVILFLFFQQKINKQHKITSETDNIVYQVKYFSDTLIVII